MAYEPNGVRPSRSSAKLFAMRRPLAVALVALALGGAGAATAGGAPSAACKTIVYRVRAGDTLFSIARRFHTTVQAIARANGLDPNGILRIGVRLRIPAPGCRDVAQTAAPKAPAPAAAAQVATASLTRALRVRHLPLGRTSALVVDLTTGDTVYSFHATTPRAPASTEKLPVELAALETLGPGFRTKTDVLTEGAVAKGVLHGSLVLKGFGDPLLGSAGLRGLARAVRQRGIASVTGGIVGDESFFDAERTAQGWKSSFYKDESPPLSALVANRSVVDGSVWDEPALAAAALFRRALERAGVHVGGTVRTRPARSGAQLLVRRRSPPLSVLVGLMGTWSDNFVAETVLKQLGAQVYDDGSSRAGTRVVWSVLAREGVPLTGDAFYDGSGLSQLDRLTASTLVGVLVAAGRDPQLGRSLVGSLSVVGETGTLRHRLVGVPGHGLVRAKSGTTDECSALAGYVGSRYAFAILSNGAPVDVWAAHTAQDRFVSALLRAAT
jgi:D-alanyl-D-alanine carboxypeptidase/D-alanyl-D-alanine-endopeptidase (penicillin-binding protein 4)